MAKKKVFFIPTVVAVEASLSPPPILAPSLALREDPEEKVPSVTKANVQSVMVRTLLANN